MVWRTFLQKILSYETEFGTKITGLAFSDDADFLGFSTHRGCGAILSLRKEDFGMVKEWRCYIDSPIIGMSYCCNKFGFANLDGLVFIYDTKTGKWTDIPLDHPYNLTLTEDGFIYGWVKFYYISLKDGSVKWEAMIKPGAFTLNIIKRPSISGNLVFLPVQEWLVTGGSGVIILNLSDGSEVSHIAINDLVLTAQACKNYLAVGSAHHVYLYDISDLTNPKLLWRYDKIATRCSFLDCQGAKSVAFSPDCKFLISINVEDWKIHMFETETGTQVFETRMPSAPTVAAWRNEKIAVGLKSGDILIYKAVPYATHQIIKIDQEDDHSLLRRKASSPLQMEF